MTAEPLSAFLVNQLTLSGSSRAPQGYYRSKLFIAPFSTNPLVAAAGPLLSLLERLSRSSTLPAVLVLRANIEHELQAFHSRLHAKSYSEEVDSLAHYLLCATIDELVGKSYLRLHDKPAEFKAFTPPALDNIGPEHRFFDIVHHIKEKPNQYLDLIELTYYCLITGFEGKQHGKADGREVLDNLIEELFQLIQNHRVNKPSSLFKETKPLENFSPRRKELIIASLVCIGLLFSGFIFNFLLVESKAKAIQQGHLAIARLDE